MNPYPHRPRGMQPGSGQTNTGVNPISNPAGTSPAGTPTTTAGPAPDTSRPAGSPTPSTWGTQRYGFDPRTMSGQTVTPDLAWYFGQDSVGRTIGQDGTVTSTFSAPRDGLGGRVPRDNRVAAPAATTTAGPISPLTDTRFGTSLPAYQTHQSGYTAGPETLPPVQPGPPVTSMPMATNSAARPAAQNPNDPNVSANNPAQTVVGGSASGGGGVEGPAGGRGGVVNAMMRRFDNRYW